MARVVGIDHISIKVGDLARSKRFYDDVLGFLGFKRKYDFTDAVGWSNGKTLFWIGEADRQGKKRKHRRGDIGFHHYAFELGKRQDVFDLETHLKEMGAEIVDPAAEYYSGGYYAVYFLDPDGLKLEGMHYPTRPKRRRRRSR
ncbi:MAG TPA: VOC family protein [Stellaceae bacterium]|nr:VOC family protein [Stellaceae bacterium]